MKMRKVVQNLRYRLHGMVEKYWARNQRPGFYTWLLGLIIYDPRNLVSSFIHSFILSFQFIVYLLSEETRMKLYLFSRSPV